jgi:Flp pilus assembly pilin Flp
MERSVHGQREWRTIDPLQRFISEEANDPSEHGLIAAGISIAILTVANRVGS